MLRNISNKMFHSICIIFIAFSCSNPVDSDYHPSVVAAGMILKNESGGEVYKQLNGNIFGEIPIPIGGSGIELSVHLLNEDGTEIVHEEEEHEVDSEEEELRVIDLQNEGIATVKVDSHDENQESSGTEEDHEMGIHITGVQIGNTTFKLQLWHNETHYDWTSLDVLVTVE